LEKTQMNRRASYLVVLFSICVVLLEILAAGTPAADTPKGSRAPDLRTHPTGGKTPVDIAVGLFVTNIVGPAENWIHNSSGFRFPRQFCLLFSMCL
jgi:hypothetical protein